MPDPPALQHADFAPLVGEAFTIRSSVVEHPIEATLIDARESTARPAPDAVRSPFSIQFQLPNTVQLPQGTVHVEHPAISPSDLFLVPIGTDDDGWYMEACFN